MTEVIKTILDWKNKLNEIQQKNSTIGFVPTMGNLHVGHLSLLQRSHKENDISVLSIFVNPTQFNNQDDLSNYPRTFDADFQKASDNKVDYIFIPEISALYPDDYAYQVQETKESNRLEGIARPGHFTGMLTVVMKLLNIVQPTRVYFGEKDYQQYELVRDMAKSFFLDCEIVPCEIIRDPDNLALSSRNNLLTKEQRDQASFFPKLLHSKDNCEVITAKLEQHGFKVDYISEYNNRRFGAVWLDDVRLIDNIPIAS